MASDDSYARYTGLPDLSGQTIFNGAVRLLSILNSGSFGIVYRAVDLTKPLTIYAVKCQYRGLSRTKREQQDQEYTINSRACGAGHRGIVKVYDCQSTDAFLFMLCEYCAGGDMFTVLAERPQFYANQSPSAIRAAMLQLVDAVAQLHETGIYHRDLKPENVLINDGSLVICDFGLATTKPYGKDFKVGSYPCMSPECTGSIVRPAYIYKRTDVWAIGVMCFCMLTGHHPWLKASSSNPHYRDYLGHRDSYFLQYGLSTEFQRLLEEVLEPVPERRMTLEDMRTALLGIQFFTAQQVEDDLHQLIAATDVRSSTLALSEVAPALTMGNSNGLDEQVVTPSLAPVVDDLRIIEDLKSLPFELNSNSRSKSCHLAPKDSRQSCHDVRDTLNNRRLEATRSASNPSLTRLKLLVHAVPAPLPRNVL